MKIRAVETELLHADLRIGRQTEKTKLMVAFSQFCKRTFLMHICTSK